MKLEKELKKFILFCNKQLNKFLCTELEENKTISVDSRNLILNIKQYCLAGGKKIRPFLFYLGFSGFNKNENKLDAKKTSIYCEIIHLSLLCLDDIMDRSEIRHQEATIHTQQKKLLKEKYKIRDEHYSNSMGMLASLILKNLASKYLLKQKISQNLKEKIFLYYNQIFNNTCFGQVLDFCLPLKKLNSIQKEDIIKNYSYKTAKYTIEAPMTAGAILAKANQKEFTKIKSFASELGIAYQIQDDILGMFSKTTKIGKSNISDLEEGKITILIWYAFSLANKDDKKKIEKLLKKEKNNEKDLTNIQKIIRQTGALEKTEEMMKNKFKNAKKLLKKINFNQKTKIIFQELINYLENRQY